MANPSLYDIDVAIKKDWYQPWLPYEELQKDHFWLILLWKRKVLTKEQMRELFVVVIETTKELPYASDCSESSNFSIDSEGNIRKKPPSKGQKALANFAQIVLEENKLDLKISKKQASKFLLIVKKFGEEFGEVGFVRQIGEELEKITLT